MKTNKYTKDRTIEEKKRDILEELQKSLGIVTLACRKTKIGRTQFYAYKKDDETFKAKVDEITETFVDMVESKLLEKVMMGDRASIMFFLKAKGRNRGFR